MPTLSSVEDSGNTPFIDQWPTVVLRPKTPHRAAGRRIDPPVSLPKANAQSPAAAATADPPQPACPSAAQGRCRPPAGCRPQRGLRGHVLIAAEDAVQTRNAIQIGAGDRLAGTLACPQIGGKAGQPRPLKRIARHQSWTCHICLNSPAIRIFSRSSAPESDQALNEERPPSRRKPTR
jgi:hypothetical protein